MSGCVFEIPDADVRFALLTGLIRPAPDGIYELTPKGKEGFVKTLREIVARDLRCNRCNGTGEIDRELLGDLTVSVESCPDCQGTGEKR